MTLELFKHSLIKHIILAEMEYGMLVQENCMAELSKLEARRRGAGYLSEKRYDGDTKPNFLWVLLKKELSPLSEDNQTGPD